jgi:hypothetical protein
MTYKCTECFMRETLRQNGFGAPHPTYTCPVCKQDYYIIEQKPSRFPPEKTKNEKEQEFKNWFLKQRWGR